MCYADKEDIENGWSKPTGSFRGSPGFFGRIPILENIARASETLTAESLRFPAHSTTVAEAKTRGWGLKPHLHCRNHTC